MDVGDESDAQAVERARQPGDGDVHVDAPDTVALVRHAVGERAGADAHARRREGPERVAARDAHRAEYS